MLLFNIKEMSLFFLNMSTLEPMSKAAFPIIKYVNTFCIKDESTTDSPSFTLHCVLKKSIHTFVISGNRCVFKSQFKLLNMISLIECIDLDTLFIADGVSYSSITLSTEQIQIICPYDRNTVNPIIQRISHNEYLLSTSNNLNGIGIFVNPFGEPTRSTIEWTQGIPRKLCSSYPYIISLFKNAMQVHDINDQRVVQSIKFNPELRSAHVLTTSLNHQKWNSIFMITLTDHSLITIMMMNFTNQIDALFTSKEYKLAIRLQVNFANTSSVKVCKFDI